MTLPAGFLDDLKARVALADVVGKRVKLTRRGRQYLGLCPFHGERTPSFHVYEDHYHCFGCGAHGSVLDFVMNLDKVDFREAVERLASLAGMIVPAPSVEAQEKERRRLSLQDATEAAAAYFQRLLRMPEGRQGLGYLQRRGVSDAAIERFRLGWAPEGHYGLKSALLRDGFVEDVLTEAGLLVQPEDGNRGAYDRFRGRVMFPIDDRRGRIIGFGGRLLGPGEPKYLNSPETPLFHKGRELYNLASATVAARTTGTVIAVEGYMDVIALVEAGYENVVAPLGTAMTEDQLQSLWRVAAEPVLLFDPDAAGERAALRAAERALPLLQPGRGLRLAFLATETADDPDGVVRRYPRQFLDHALSTALALSDFLFWVETRGRRLDSAEQRAAIEHRLRERAAQVSHPAVRKHLQSALRERLWQHHRSARAAGRAGRPSTAAEAITFPVPTEPAPGGSTSLAERTLLAILLLHPAFFHEVEDELGSLVFAEASLDQLRQELVQLLSGADGSIDSDTVSEQVATHGLGNIVDDILRDPLIRSHRQISADAPPSCVRQTWIENAARVRSGMYGDGNERQWERSQGGAIARELARLRAALADDTD